MKVMTANFPQHAQADAQLDAARRAMETLLNCYCREVAAPHGQLQVGPPGAQDDWPQSLRMAMRAAVAGAGGAAGPGVLQIALPHTRARLLVAVAAPSHTGNFSYVSAFYAKTDGKPWAILDWEALAATLLRELGQQTGTGHNEELMQQMRDSVGVTAAVLAVADPGPFAAQPAAAFIASEQSLLFGHPFHPAPKSRQGVTHADMLRYSPETGARFPLHYFAVRREHLMQRSLLERSCDRIVAAQAPAWRRTTAMRCCRCIRGRPATCWSILWWRPRWSRASCATSARMAPTISPPRPSARCTTRTSNTSTSAR